MKRLAAAGALALVLVSPAYAAPGQANQDQAKRSQARSATPAQQSATPSTLHVTSAGDIAGRFAYDKNGRDAGWVQSVMIDARTGDVGYLVIGSDANFDIGAKVIAVPWTKATKPQLWGDRSLVLDTTVDKLQKAPRLDRADLSRLVEPVEIRRVTDYYAEPSSDQAANSGSGTPPATAGEATGNPYLMVGQSVVEAVVPQPVVAANAIEDAEVLASNGDRVGEIDRVVVDLDHGRVAYLLMTRGDVLGLNGEWVPVPLEALSWSPQKEAFVLRGDAQKLQAMQGFPKQDLPTRISTAQLAKLYADFGLPPYWQSAGQGAGGSKAG
jgi:sporulation protein YlmC with PRC-barrel domain